MIENKLSEDIFINIVKYINHENVIHILKNIDRDELISQIHFEELVDYNNIKELSYSDNFNNIELTSYNGYIPFKKKIKDEHINVKYLIFDNTFNQPLKQGDIPCSVKKLTFGYDFNQPLEEGIIPYSVIDLTFGFNFNQLLKQEDIPCSVNKLTFGNNFNQPLEEGIIPSSVMDLTFQGHFNQPLKEGDIPCSVKKLTFMGDFNQPLEEGIIPFSVMDLTFKGYFNQPLKEGDIPCSVKKLTFGKDFNQLLKQGDIPCSVTELTFGKDFNQPLKQEDIPSSVTKLTFGSNFNQPLKQGDIPFSVTELTFGSDFNQSLKQGDIPSSVTKLTFDMKFNKQGEIEIHGGPADAAIKVRVWPDANHQVAQIEAESAKEFQMQVALETWRPGDSIATGQKDRIAWHHRNPTSPWKEMLEQQHLQPAIKLGKDPLLHRTFGGLIKGKGLVRVDDKTLSTAAPGKQFRVAVHTHTMTPAAVAEWLAAIEKNAAAATPSILNRRVRRIAIGGTLSGIAVGFAPRARLPPRRPLWATFFSGSFRPAPAVDITRSSSTARFSRSTGFTKA